MSYLFIHVKGVAGAHSLESLMEGHKLFLNSWDSSEINHCLHLIYYSKSRIKPPTILDQLFMTFVSGSSEHNTYTDTELPHHSPSSQIQTADEHTQTDIDLLVIFL
jgi:hypothetical protein